MDRQTESVYAHVDQPAFEQMQIDQNISRVAIFFVCFLTIAVFYFTLVNFPVAKLLPVQQIQQVGSIVSSLNPAASRTPASAAKPTGALGGSQIGSSAAPSASASAAPASIAASAASPASAKPSSSAGVPAGGAYTVASGDTLTTIARRFNTNAQTIADANKMTTNAPLRVGQKLVIPG
ncbi:MAG TPA: LysM peptidoglycan-binding domain-containing protein [Chloroflexota bacterium]|nr:LysM peptidoglycan-binding domain-containing protein [Chloroflexota bacterium]